MTENPNVTLRKYNRFPEGNDTALKMADTQPSDPPQTPDLSSATGRRRAFSTSATLNTAFSLDDENSPQLPKAAATVRQTMLRNNIIN
jgi:hypothetical protein